MLDKMEQTLTSVTNEKKAKAAVRVRERGERAAGGANRHPAVRRRTFCCM